MICFTLQCFVFPCEQVLYLKIILAKLTENV
jgi:hypothetical protein